MRHIVKQGQGSRKLQQASLRPPQSGAAATAGWSAFRQYGGGAELLNNHLLPEQYGLCAYSELDADRLGLGFHIEHVDNKSQNPARTFDYQNLIASAFSSEEGLPLAIVSLRKDWWDEMESLYAEHLDKGWSLNDLAAVDLLPRQQQLSRFFTLTRQFFGPVAENLLRQNAPQLL